MPPSYQRLKTMVKTSSGSEKRARNFVAQKDRIVKGAPAKIRTEKKAVSVERREIAIRGKQMASTKGDAVSATMTVNVTKVHAHPLPLLSRRPESMGKTLRKAGLPERSVHRVRGS